MLTAVTNSVNVLPPFHPFSFLERVKGGLRFLRCEDEKLTSTMATRAAICDGSRPTRSLWQKNSVMYWKWQT